MLSSHKHTARSVVDAFYKAEREYMSAPADQRDFRGIAASLAPDFKMEQTSALPYAGVYVGPSGMQEWSQKMANYFEVVDARNPEMFEKEGSDSVIVLSTVHFKVRQTGEELDSPMCQVITVDLERGVLKGLKPFYWDVPAVNAALGY